jgi:hypothetical protein
VLLERLGILHRRRLAAGLLCLAVAAVSGACGGPAPSIAPNATAISTSQPAPQSGMAGNLEPGEVEALAVREQYGLRADVDWIRRVANDPSAVVPEEYGIPLMPDELGDLLSRRWPNTLIVQLRAYGEQFPEDFATAYINEKASGAIVKFKANLDRHRAALAVLPLDGPVIVEAADWSLKELNAFLGRVKDEQRWIESTGAKWVNPVVYELENRVVIRYEGPAGLEGTIERHFGSPAWLEARWEGYGR